MLHRKYHVFFAQLGNLSSVGFHLGCDCPLKCLHAKEHRESGVEFKEQPQRDKRHSYIGN